mgnify:CR=1 FL=1
MTNKKLIHKQIAEIVPVLTGHGIGAKKVLISQEELSSPITQIAQTTLRRGDIVVTHKHPTMDEHFIFLEGECELTLNETKICCKGGEYLLIPAGVRHQIEVISDTTMITVGVAKE